MRARFLLAVLLSAMLPACGDAPAPTFRIADGQLFFVDPERGEQLLADDALDYVVHVAPGNELIAVETVLFSNLQTLRVYRRAGRRWSEVEGVSSSLWEQASRQLGLDTEAIERARCRFKRWDDDGNAVLTMSGETAAGEFALELRHDLDEGATP